LNGECGPISLANFGKFIPTSTLFDEAVTKHNRDYLWDINLELQHEVTRGLSVSADYNRNWDGSFTVMENTLLGPANFDEFCITAPVDAHLPGGGGNEICGLYDVQPQYFGLGTLRVTNAISHTTSGACRSPSRTRRRAWQAPSRRSAVWSRRG
jgi:hypothetical protein